MVQIKKKTEIRDNKILSGLRFLSESAMKFVKMSSDEDIYRIIAQQLKELIKDGYVGVVSYNSSTNEVEVRALAGIKNRLQETLKILGRHPVGMKFSLDHGPTIQRIKKGYLTDVPDGLYDAAQHKIPKKITNVLENRFNLKAIMSVGFIREGQIYGAALLFLKRILPPDEKELVNTYINQAAVALYRWHAEQKITASLKEKEVLLREIHHRVKNNMQIISSLLRLQAEKVKDSNLRESFKISQNRIRSMALIHEELYRSTDLAHINIEQYIHKLTTQLFSSYGISKKRIKLTIDIDDIPFNINQAIPCGLIINELVSNSLKHAFPGGRTGMITININKLKSRKQLIIKDNGIGFPKDNKQNKYESLGLQIVRDLVRQLEGNLKVNREAGTEFIISF